MSETKFVTAVRQSTSYAGSPILKTPHTTLSVTGVSGLSILISGVTSIAEGTELCAELTETDDGWTDFLFHDYESVAEAWAHARLAEFRNLPVYTIGQWVDEHYGTTIDTAVMTRRDDLVAGDIYLSSHFGKTQIASVSSRGLSTTIRGSRPHQLESSDRSGLVPVFRGPRGYEQHGYDEFVAALAGTPGH